MRRRPLLLAIVLGLSLPAVPGSASASAASTPELIERAVAASHLDRVTADVYLWSAFRRPQDIPSHLRGTGPWRGTEVLLGLTERLRSMPHGPDRSRLLDVAGPLGPGLSRCGSGSVVGLDSFLPQAMTFETQHFRIEYTPGTITGGLTIQDYAEALESAWSVEVDSFGWPAPPHEGRYLVRVDATLAPGLYGYVAVQQTIGDNPNTEWNDQHAATSCMALNANYGIPVYPSAPRDSMRATIAHELLHSLQFGIGAHAGSNRPALNFLEGSATWMEDEVFDDANDNHFLLWPSFTDSMGAYPAGYPYPYWIVFRGLTERFGTGIAGGGERIIRDFFLLTSQRAGDNLTAMQAALDNAGLPLGEAYHDVAIAVWFMRACGGGYVLPYCFAEAEDYVRASGAPSRPSRVVGLDATVAVEVRKDYAMGWVVLPTQTGPYDVDLRNASTGGSLRVSIACDTGTGLVPTAALSVLDPGDQTTIAGYDPAGCREAVAVVTNEAVTVANPTSSTPHALEVSLTAS